ncbi:hypothetical protein D3C86_1299980 [compost metagenome]
MVVAAGIHAAGDIEADITQVVQIVQVFETSLNRLGDGDGLGIGQRAEVAARAGNDIGQQTDIGAAQALFAGQAPEGEQLGFRHVGQDNVLLMGDADFSKTEMLGPRCNRVHLLGGDITGRGRDARFGRQHDAGITRHLMRLDIARHPTGKRRVLCQTRAEFQVGIGQ